MNISFSSLLTGLLFGSIFMSIVVLILKKKQFAGKFQINFLMVCLLLIVIRMTIPIELKATKSVGCTFLLPDLRRILRLTLWESNLTLESALLLIWVVVATIKFVLFLISHTRFHAFINKLPICEEETIKELLEKICNEVACKNKFTVIRIEACKSPFILGIFHPKIILPQLELSNTDLEFILRHEIGHYIHKDLWKKYMMEFACIFYWWNPLIFFLKKELDNVLELRRDEVITEGLDESNKVLYLECLLKIAKENNQFENQKQMLAFCKNINTGSLEQRFIYVLDHHSEQKKYNSFFCWFICISLLVLSFCFVFEPFSIPAKDEVETFELNTDSTYILEKEGVFYLYVNGVFTAKMDEIKEFYKDLPVYTEEKNREKSE